MRLVSKAIASLLVSSIVLSNSPLAWSAEPAAPLAPLPVAPAPAPSVPPAVSVTPGGGAPDVVRLKNGGMVRGTINEIVPDGDVVILTVIGEVRRFPMKDVAYAGPIADAPGAAKAAPAPAAPATTAPVSSESVAVEFESPTPDLMVQDRTFSAQGVVSGTGGSANLRLSEYRELCVAPCKSQVSVGGHTFAVSSGSGRLIEAPAAITINAASKVKVDYTSKSDIRSSGVVLAVVGIAGAIIGPAVILGSRPDCTAAGSAAKAASCIENDDTSQNAGIALAIGGAVGTVGILLALLVKDTVDFKLASPGLPPSPAGSASGAGDKSASRAWLHFGSQGVGVHF